MSWIFSNSKRLQDAKDASLENLKTIDECKKKIAENIEQEKGEMQRKTSLKKKNEKLTEEV